MCPYLATWWDRETKHSYPTDENVCYANVGVRRILAIFWKRPHGRGVKENHQKIFCYGDYRTCLLYSSTRQNDLQVVKTARGDS